MTGSGARQREVEIARATFSERAILNEALRAQKF